MVRKRLQVELDKWCDSYEWDAKAALDAGDMVHLRSVSIRAALVSELLEPFGLKVADNVGIVHVGSICLHVDLKLSARNLGFFSKPWQVTVEDVDVVLELANQTGIDGNAGAAASGTAQTTQMTLSGRSNMSADEAAVSAEAPHGLSCRYVILTVTARAALGMTLANPEPRARGGAPRYPDTPRLTALAPGGLAEQSGLLQLGDWISCINGVRVHDPQHAARTVAGLAAPPTNSAPLRTKGAVRLQVLRAAPPAARVHMLPGGLVPSQPVRGLSWLAGNHGDFRPK